MKRSLTPKVNLVPPRSTDTLDVSDLFTDRVAATVKPIATEGRRVRPSTLLSLAAISMGAAGVLFPSASKANATEAALPQLPLPSEATNNPYQAVVPAEAPTLALATLDESQGRAAERLAEEQIEAENPLAELALPLAAPSERSTNSESSSFSAEVADTSTSFPGVVDIKQGALSRPTTATSVETPTSAKKHSKVVTAQLSESVKNNEDLELSAAASTPVAPLQSALNTPADSPDAAEADQPQLVVPTPPAAVAKRPASVEADREAISLSVPPPETAGNVSEPTLTIPVPAPAARLPQALEPQPEVVEAAQPELIAPETTAPKADAEVRYQVRSGDTIDAIALRYGISRSELVRVNGLNNPHQIQIAQELKIPQPQSLRPSSERPEIAIPGFNIVPPDENRARVTSGPLPQTPAVIAESRPSTVVPTETTLADRPKSDSVSVAATPNDESQSSARTEGNTIVNAAPNPYIERLKADIMRMRQEYRAGNNAEGSTTEAAASENTTVVVADAAPAAPASVNPQWPSDRRSNTVETSANALQVYSVRVRDNRSEAARGQATENQIAVAPVPPVEYNSNTRPQTGIQVAPELPPLSPERYLPDGRPAQFNGYMWPAAGVLTSGYGRRWGRMHRGIDIAGPTGTPIVAAAGGEVVTAGWNSGGFGNLVDIRHPDGSMTRYAHNSKILVRKGQWVEQGERVALMGSTGFSTGPHLHFEIHRTGSGAVNPIALLPSR